MFTYILLAFIMVLTILAIIGFVYHPQRRRTYINPNTSVLNPVCSETPVECTSDADCTKCTDSDIFEIKCQDMKGGKYCLPVKPDQPCNLDLGGVWTWSGWADSENKEWECLCTYPEIAGGKGCTRLNPNVCSGGTYTYHAIHADRAPSPQDCTCGDGATKVVTKENVPLCVRNRDGIDLSFYTTM